MALIQEDVRNYHLSRHPTEVQFLTPFLSGFDITWAGKRLYQNTDLSVYFLRPEPGMAEMFGFTQEIMLVYRAC